LLIGSCAIVLLCLFGSEVVLLDGLQESVDLVSLTDLDVLETVGSIDVDGSDQVTGKDNWGGFAESDDGLWSIDVVSFGVLVEVGLDWGQVSFGEIPNFNSSIVSNR
jgi:hypothetical protein